MRVVRNTSAPHCRVPCRILDVSLCRPASVTSQLWVASATDRIVLARHANAADSAGRHGGDALDHILGAAVASSARRCEGAWPARGRPDPVRQQCMLGGQLSLEVACEAVCGGAPQLLTASCSAPVGWDQSRNQGLGAVASCNIVAAGYANGSIELIFDSGRGAHPCVVVRYGLCI